MYDGYEAVVFDLDGTLVDLPVDWEAVRAEVAGVLRARGIDVDGLDLWALLERADATGFRDPVESVIAEHEREAARTATRLAPADDLPGDLPVGVCSLNCEAACRIALEMHGLDGHVAAIVGRDSIGVSKPDPEPLRSVISAIGGTPETTLFVGDSQRDADTATAAGVDFRWVSDWQAA